MRDFMMAAVTLVVAGIALAVFFAGRAEKKKTQEKKNDYEAMGMSLGCASGPPLVPFSRSTSASPCLWGCSLGWSSECVSGRSTNEKIRGMLYVSEGTPTRIKQAK